MTMAKTSTEDLRLALSDIQKTLEGLVIGPPVTSIPAQRAIYQLSLVKKMLDDGREWRYHRIAIHEFDKRHAEKAKKIQKAAS